MLKQQRSRSLVCTVFFRGVNAALPIDQASLPVDEVNFSLDPPFQSRSFLLHISFDFDFFLSF